MPADNPASEKKRFRDEQASIKSFLGHLDDLRSALLKSSVAVFLGIVVCLAFTSKLFAILLSPYITLLRQMGELDLRGIDIIRSLSPSETLLVSIKLVFIMSLILASPVIFYQIWSFISPGLIQKERRYLKIVFCLCPLLFLCGALFAYYLVFPLGLRFLWSYTVQMGAYPEWTVSYYFNFALVFLFAFGIAFELPVVIILLAKLGLVTPKVLTEKRRHAIVVIFIIAAILTPPDVVSQILLGLPMWLLYELSILMVKLVSKGKL